MKSGRRCTRQPYSPVAFYVAGIFRKIRWQHDLQCSSGGSSTVCIPTLLLGGTWGWEPKYSFRWQGRVTRFHGRRPSCHNKSCPAESDDEARWSNRSHSSAPVCIRFIQHRTLPDTFPCSAYPSDLVTVWQTCAPKEFRAGQRQRAQQQQYSHEPPTAGKHRTVELLEIKAWKSKGERWN